MMFPSLVPLRKLQSCSTRTRRREGIEEKGGKGLSDQMTLACLKRGCLLLKTFLRRRGEGEEARGGSRLG